MKWRLLFTIWVLIGASWAQIDTRVSPLPAPSAPDQVPAEPRSSSFLETSGSFLRNELASDIAQNVEGTLALSESVTNQIPSASNNYPFDEFSELMGTLSVHDEGRRGLVTMQYAGGTDLYVNNSYLNRQFHELSASESAKWSRWNLSLGEGFSYLPESGFGFDPLHSIGNGITSAGGQSGGPVSALFLPANVIQRMISGNAGAEYIIGPRSSISSTAAFTDQHFSGSVAGSTLIDSQILTSATQYTYARDAANTFGAKYEFTQTRGTNFGGVMRSQSAEVTYDRMLSKHLTIQLAAGPQFTTINQSGIERTLGVSSQINSAARYQAGLTGFGVTYFRGVDSGTGFFLGSHSNDIRGFVDRQFGRQVISASVGHGQNTSLSTLNTNQAQQIDSTYLALSMTRQIGRMLSLFITYGIQNQDTSVDGCSNVDCAALPLVHTFTLGLRFHIHPFTLRP